MFQFRYGSIKTIEERIKGGLGLMFQFRYGSIKTTQYNYPNEIYACFNSDMVRLRL